MESNRPSRDELDDGIRRVEKALARSLTRTAPFLEQAISDAGARALAQQVSLRQDRALRRAQRRMRKDEEASVAHAIVLGVAAAVAAWFALTQPHLWWMFFVAFGFGMGGADRLARARRRDRALPLPESPLSLEETPAAERVPAPAPPAEEPVVAAITVRLQRVDQICQKLVDELKGAPQAVRELIRRPEETVAALRAASHELARRERELRAAIPEEDGDRLRRERRELEERVTAAPDDVVRGRLTAALEALDAQLTHRVGLATAAARIEAEGTRILYSLESLRAQVLRTWAADTAAADLSGEGLRGSLETLSREIDAVATALEEVHAEPAAQPASSSRAAQKAQAAGAASRTL